MLTNAGMEMAAILSGPAGSVTAIGLSETPFTAALGKGLGAGIKKVRIELVILTQNNVPIFRIYTTIYRGGPTNSSGRKSSKGGGGVQVRGNVNILTSKSKNSKGR